MASILALPMLRLLCNAATRITVRSSSYVRIWEKIPVFDRQRYGKPRIGSRQKVKPIHELLLVLLFVHDAWACVSTRDGGSRGGFGGLGSFWGLGNWKTLHSSASQFVGLLGVLFAAVPTAK